MAEHAGPFEVRGALALIAMADTIANTSECERGALIRALSAAADTRQKRADLNVLAEILKHAWVATL